jgi:hypothetical protein
VPSAATQSPGTAGSTNRGGQQARPMVPFIRASARHIEAPFYDQTFTQNANLQDLGVIEIPAYGYVRNLIFYVNCITAANAATVTFNEDSPWTVLQNIQFNEPNGAQIVQVNDGYELYLIDKWSGFMGPGLSNDHRADPNYSQVVGGGGTGGSYSFMLRVPVELDLRSGLGSLPNQAANATFRIRAAIAPLSVVYGTSPTTGGAVRVRIMAETWDQPEVSSGGATNQVTPPAMNTTAFWSRQVYNVGSGGSQTVRLTRVGNYLRNQIFILRSGTTVALQGAGPRSLAEPLWTTPAAAVGGSVAPVSDGQVTFFIDSRPVQILNDRLWHMYMWERSGGYGGFLANQPGAYDVSYGNPSGQTPTTLLDQNANDTPYGLDNGVRVLDWMTEFDGNYGRENRDLWQPTLGSTRFEIQSNFGVLAAGSTLTVLTNDVAIAGNVFLS